MSGGVSGPPPPPPSGVLRGHTADVMVARFAPWRDSADLPVLFSASSDGELRLWSLRTHRTTLCASVHPGKSILEVLPLSPERVFTQGRDGIVRIWNLTQGGAACTRELAVGGSGFCACAVWSPGDATPSATPGADATGRSVLAAASVDMQTAVLYDLRQRDDPIDIMPAPPQHDRSGMCFCLRFLDETHLVSGWEDGSLQLFDLRRCDLPMAARQLHKEPLLSVELEPRRNAVLTGSADRKIFMVPLGIAPLANAIDGDEATGGLRVGLSERRALLGRAKQVVLPITNEVTSSGGTNDLASRPDAKVFAAAGWDKRVRVWAWKNLKPLALFKQHTLPVNSLTWSGCSHWLASASADKTIAIWSSLFNPPPRLPH